MKKTLLTLNLIVSALLSNAQQSLTLYNMDVIGQSNQINPSLMPENNWYIGVPALSSTSFTFSNSGFAWTDLHWKRQDDSVNLDIENAISKMPEKNYISIAVREDILEGGFKIKNNYFSFNVTEILNLNLTFPKELFELFLKGNGAFIGQEVDLKRMAFDATHYREYAIGWTRALNKQATIGGRIKYLYGMENFSSGESNLSFYTAPDDYQLELTSGYTINTSTSSNSSNGNGGSYMFGLKNTGFAADFSGTYFYSERWKFNASIIDFGYINWRSNVKNLVTAKGNYSFNGIDINKFISDSSSSLSNVMDSISNSFKPVETTEAYKTNIPTHLYFNAIYKLNAKLSLSGLAHAVIFRETVQPTFTASINGRITDHFSASINFSMINHHFNNVGAGFAANMGAFQFFLLSDNWIGTIYPLSNSTANFQFGFNLIYGRHKTKKAPDFGVQNKTIKPNTNGAIMAEPIEEELPKDKEQKK